jgi:16S rRNA (adenine1518-N6/adenine1519-N6)-dimethyltransferase
MTDRLADEPTSGAALPPLREVIARYGLGARKSLGQHFLFDLNLTRRIARAAGDLSSGTVIEIGPGPGGLTRALLDCGARRLVVVERDQRCLEALEQIGTAYPGRLDIVAADALGIRIAGLGPAPRRIVANLPYNVSTALLINWLREASDLAALVLMFQKEVAERLLARPRSKAYGRLSVITQWRMQARSLFDIPARAFTPPPKVVSTVVELIPRAEPLAPCRMETLERVTAAAFGQRRKMLRQSLRSLGVAPTVLIDAASVPETARAEELDIPAFCALARALDAAGSTDLRAAP